MIFSLFGYFFIADFPEEAKFLTEPEREFVINKLQKDIGKSAYQPITFKDVVITFRDWKVWVGGFMYLGLIVPAYGTLIL
jgi:hypothetical protein